MIFKNFKVNYAKGELKLLQVFGKTILSIEHLRDSENKYNQAIKINTPLFKKFDSQKRIFYLKVSKKNYGYSLICLQQWIDLIEKMNADFYFICDDEDLKETILKNIRFYNNDIKFLKSDRKTFKPLLDKLCSDFLHNIAFAHLTAYSHAKKNNIEDYWDIDADDIYLFTNTDNLEKIIKSAEEKAKEQNIDIFSLDTKHSANLGLLWSFGATYIKSSVDLTNVLKTVNPVNLIDYYSHFFGKNNRTSGLNEVFTYIKAVNLLKIRTFNVPNLYCMNWGMCNFKDFPRMLQHTQNDNLIDLPLFKIFKNKEYDKPRCGIITLNDINLHEFNSENLMKKFLFNHAEYTFACKKEADNTKMKTIIFKNN